MHPELLSKCAATEKRPLQQREPSSCKSWTSWKSCFRQQKKRATVKPMARFACLSNSRKGKPASGLEDLHVYRTCRESVPAVGQDRLILTRLRSGDRKLQEFIGYNSKDLTALEKRRAAFVYRHIGHSKPKEVPALPPELLRRTQTTLILKTLTILSILLQTTSTRRCRCKMDCDAQHCRVNSPGFDRLRSGKRKL